MTIPGDTQKRREIVFHATPPAQTARAYAQLSMLPDMVVTRVGEYTLQVHYSVTDHTLEDLESLLVELGYHLETTLLLRLKRALIYHVERVQRENLGKPEVKTKNYKPHMQAWEHRPHGDHDETPEEWRQYR